MTTVTFRITGIPGRAAGVRDRIALSTIEGAEVILRSAIGPEAPLNEQLVWLWGLLKHQRRFLKGLQSDGATLQCICSVSGRRIHIQANGAEMLHLLGAELVIDVR